MPNLVLCLLVFLVVVPGLAWPLASRLALSAAEKLCATVALSLLAVYLLAFARYVLVLPVGAFWALPVLAAAGLMTGRRAFVEMLRDREVRALLLGQALVSAWCLGWLSFIVSYSGGGWSGDWLEHWQRTRFFLEHWPLQMKFLSLFQLPARPPLANLVSGALVGGTGVNFSAYQLILTLLNTLAFLPAALLVRRFQPTGNASRTAVATLAVLLMLNPCFLQNATYAWTKLFTVFFILAGLYFFLRAHDPAPPRAAVPLAAAALAAGLLTHYSAGTYVALLGLAWFWLNCRRWREADFWRSTFLAGLIGAAILATWLGWSLATYGAGLTLANTSGVGTVPVPGGDLLRVTQNVRDTLVPIFLRKVDMGILQQSSPWGAWRDEFFQIYQLNLLFMFGSVGWLVLGRALGRGFHSAPARSRWFWVFFGTGAVLLGVAVIGGRDQWGLAHLGLQTLLLLGLAYLAARWADLSRGWRYALVAGVTCDFCLGIALHFGVQNFLPDRWFNPARTMADTLASYTMFTQVNAYNKASRGLHFLGDVLPLPGVLVLALLAGILTLAVARATRRPR